MHYKRLLEKEIDNYYTKNCRGAYVRSRALWMEKVEKNISYFYNLEKKQQSNNPITQIRDVNDNLITDDDKIMKSLLNFIVHNILAKTSLIKI